MAICLTDLITLPYPSPLAESESERSRALLLPTQGVCVSNCRIYSDSVLSEPLGCAEREGHLATAPDASTVMWLGPEAGGWHPPPPCCELSLTIPYSQASESTGSESRDSTNHRTEIFGEKNPGNSKKLLLSGFPEFTVPGNF